MKHIGYILRKFPVISETFVIQEILQMENLGHKVTIFSIDTPAKICLHEDLKKLKAEVITLPKSLPLDIAMLKGIGYVIRSGKIELLHRLKQGAYIARLAKGLQIDHFHAHFATRAATCALFASMLSKIPYSFTAHAVDIFKETQCKKALSEKMKRALFVSTVSDYNLNYLKAIEDKKELHKVLNGIDLAKFKPAAPPSAPFTFLCIARLVEKKGHTYLIEACRKLLEKGIDFKCLLVGDGPLKETLLTQIQESNLQDTLFLLGSKTHEEVISLIETSHAFVLPCVEGKDGNKDGLPVSIVEALASSLPVITTPMTGNPEVVKEGVNGFLVPFADAACLADKMEMLIKDQALFETLKKNARSSIADQFDRQKTARTLSNLINGVSR